MSNMTEGSPSVFVKRDWLNIQDQMNGNYGSNQIIIDTSALANSNKYMAYREAYLSIPMVLSVASPQVTTVQIRGEVNSGQTGLHNGAVIVATGQQINPATTASINGAAVSGAAGVTALASPAITGTGVLAFTGTTTAAVGSTITVTVTLNSGYQDFFGATPTFQQARIVGLKSWFGSIIHSLTLDYAGTTILQQTPWQSMWTQFGLLTTLGQSDLDMNASTIGFYPDTANGFQFSSASSPGGEGALWNVPGGMLGAQASATCGLTGAGNIGMARRQLNTLIDSTAPAGCGSSTFSVLQTQTQMGSLYRSMVSSYVNNSGNTGIVYQIQAQIYLRHIHSFFSQVPLLKGVFFRLTLNINQPYVCVTRGTSTGYNDLGVKSITSPLGGVVPILISGLNEPEVALITDASDSVLIQSPVVGTAINNASPTDLCVALNVGNTILNQTQLNLLGSNTQTKLNQSCFLYVPSYTFNPSFEESYLSRPTKAVVYTDIYQFTTSSVKSGAQFNFLLTNGISNIKSVLILPFFPNILTSGELGATSTVGYPVYQSPFDCAGCGPTSPLTSIQNFNVVVAGQNMIYNTQQYNFEQFLNQLVGVNSINANLTDGLTSGLIDFKSFQQAYSYYYVNCSRMLPIDEAVPKSVSIQGTNVSQSSVQYLCFIEYGVQVSVDVLTGARV